MHPRTEELLAHLDRHRDRVRQALDAAPLGLREQQPAADRWSVAGVLEHLGVVESQLTLLLKRGLRAAQASGQLPPDADTDAIVPTVDAARLLDRERRIQAREALHPHGGMTATQAWQQLEQSRLALRDLVLSADGLDTGVVKAPHPVLGVLDFRQWVVFVGLHEARHAAQIEATVAALQAGGS
jgi:uncharacterized damage-inducible protein DinB